MGSRNGDGWRGLTRDQRTGLILQHGSMTMSRSEIAGVIAALGYHGVTRNAIIGHIARHISHWTKAPKPRARTIDAAPAGAARKAVTPPRVERRNPIVTPKPGKAMPMKPVTSKVEPLPPRMLALVDLEPRDCRYVYGDPKGRHGFCGHPKMDGSPYCEAHHFICHEVAA